jgi:hypothetical protein
LLSIVTRIFIYILLKLFNFFLLWNFVYDLFNLFLF